MSDEAMIGRTLGHYRIRSQLGAGGMGEVYLAEDLRLHRLVALKLLAGPLVPTPDDLARLEREARAVAALNHPAIVTLYSFEESEDLRFLTMELVEGASLDRALPRDGLPLDRLLDIGIAVADALAAAHQRGVIHRDLKPANVMLTADGRVKVLDFGLAKLVRPPAADDEADLSRAVTLTRRGAVLGTVHYMAPEQLREQPVDARSDLYSFGALLYELACGRRAFGGDSAAEVASKVLRDPPPTLLSRRGDLPRGLVRVVERCLEKKPADRFQSAAELRGELEKLRDESRALSSGATAELPAGAAPRHPRWARRWLLGAAAAVVSLLLVGYALRARTSAPDTPAEEGPIARSLLVLPFEDIGGDSDEEYFALGITEALIGELGKVAAIDVFPRITSMRYRGADASLERISAELDADAVVAGSVQQAGGKARVRVELIRLPGATRLWSESYESELGDVFVLQSRIAREITGQVKVSLAPLEERRLLAARATDPETMRQYLKGRYFVELLSRDGFTRAVEAFDRAIARDPTWAPAYAALATAYATRVVAGYGDPSADWGRAAEAVAAALERDPGNEEALSLQGMIEMFHHWNWAAASDQIARARRENPRAAAVLDNLSSLLLVTGDAERAIDLHRSALATNPLSHDLSCRLVRKYYAAGRFEEAIQLGRATADEFPTCPFEHLATAEALIQTGRLDEAIEHLERSLAIGVTDRGLARLGSAQWMSGRQDAARQTLQRLEAMPRADPYHIAALHAVMGQRGEALRALEEAAARRSVWVPYLSLEPAFATLRDEPRFTTIVRRIGLPAD